MKLIYIILTMVLLACITACQNDTIDVGGAGSSAFVISAGEGGDYKKARSVGNPQFQAGTLFHLYGTTTDADNKELWALNYLCGDGKGVDIAKANATAYNSGLNAWTLASTQEQKDGGFGVAGVFHTKLLNLYGVAVVGVMADNTPDTEEQISANNGILESYLSAGTKLNGIPQYSVGYTDAETGTTKAPLPDIMWSDSLKGIISKNNAGNIVMPYVHTLSKLNFYATLAPDLDEAYTNMKITGITITDYAGGTLNMADGLYNRDAVETRSVDADVAYYIADMKLTERAQYFSTTLAFPTREAVYAIKAGETENQPINVKLSVVYGQNFENSKTYVVPLAYDKDKYQVFKPNHEYDVTFSITTNSVIVTLVPGFYEVVEDIELFDYELGEPIDFGGVLWATQNLGATSSDPTESAIAWEKSRGFYYQLGRSIPYYVGGSMDDPYPNTAIYGRDISYDSSNPDSWWDGEHEWWLYTDKGMKEYGLSENVRVPYGRVNFGNDSIHGARAWPYLPALWEAVFRKGGRYEDYQRGTRFYSTEFDNEQTEPSESISDPYYIKNYLNSSLEDLKKNLNKFAFSMYDERKRWHRSDGTKSDNWITGGTGNSPAPKGWRLPTEAEFLSIIPPNDTLGDIAFTVFSKENVDTLTQRTFRYFSKEKKVGDYKGDNGVYVGIYQDGSGYNDLGKTEFSSDGKKYTCKEGWGSVFCIKRYQTGEAYLIRWQIEIADRKEVKAGLVVPSRYDVLEDISETMRPYIGRGVLVISKYDLSIDNKEALCIIAEEVSGVKKGDTLASHICRVFVDYNGNQKWDKATEDSVRVNWNRPSGQLKLPISGYVLVNGDGAQALIYPGSEGIYWTASEGVNGYDGRTIRIKFSGDYSTRFIQRFDKEKPVNGCQIRCVRDTKADYQ